MHTTYEILPIQSCPIRVRKFINYNSKARIHWHDGRTWDIEKTLHSCTSEGDFKGIRYTVLIGSAEKYLYRIDDKWYVESIQPEVDTG